MKIRASHKFLLQLLVIIAGAGAVRFWALDLCAWRRDQAEALARAIDFAQNGNFPLRGLTASVGRPNPPGFIWLVAIPALIRPTPVFATGFIALLNVIAVFFTAMAGRRLAGPRAGLMAAALLALNPWAVMGSRMLWAQSVLPFFSSLIMWMMAEWIRRPRTLPLAVLCLASAFMPQAHFSAVAILPVPALAIVYGARKHRIPAKAVIPPLLILSIVCVAMWTPYCIELRPSGVNGKSSHSGIAAEVFEGVPPHDTSPSPPHSVYPPVIASTLNIHSADFIEYWTGKWVHTLHTRRPLWKTYGAITGFALLVSAAAASGFWRRRRKRASPRQVFAKLLLIWLALPGAALCALVQWNFPHYFLICLPAGFLLMARHAEILSRSWMSGAFTRRFQLLLILSLGFAAVFLFCMSQELAVNRGFPEGEYGTALRYIGQELYTENEY
jgi:4-amino-4-deoxy-L-arabinose transferase-like glycosyltransferase